MASVSEVWVCLPLSLSPCSGAVKVGVACNAAVHVLSLHRHGRGGNEGSSRHNGEESSNLGGEHCW